MLAMEDIHIGRLAIGPVPRVVGTITTYAALASMLPLRAAICDCIEVRLDLVGLDHADWPTHCAAIEAAGTPVILTLRDASEGGRWQGGDANRLEIVDQALQALSTVDVEAGSGICDAVCALGRERQKPVILSSHDFQATPPKEALLAKIATMRRHSNAIPKLATMIRAAGDVDVLKAVLASTGRGPLCLIGMGEQGVESRVTLPSLGSCLTYGYMDTPSAPGQWPVAALFQRIHGVRGGG